MANKKPIAGQAAIETVSLTKRYSEDVLAVDRLDLAIASGTIYAFLGPNGAGKTTTISMLTTLLRPTEGHATVAGFDVEKEPDQVRQRIGVTFQELVLDDDLTGSQVLEYHGRLYHMPVSQRRRKISELLAMVGLTEASKRRTKTYSGGMKRRLELARGLMTDPQILFLDEPTLGLDPQNRVAVWDYIRSLREEARLTLLLTTHYMEEAESLAERVGIIDRGKLVAAGSPQQLIHGMGADVVRIRGEGDLASFSLRVSSLEGVESVSAESDCVLVGVDQGSQRLASIVEAAIATDLAIAEVNVSSPNLGDAFLKVTGREFREE
jgi:ABC-2 type transport system ATP-binding protein